MPTFKYVPNTCEQITSGNEATLARLRGDIESHTTQYSWNCGQKPGVCIAAGWKDMAEEIETAENSNSSASPLTE